MASRTVVARPPVLAHKGAPLTQPAALQQQLIQPLDVAGLRHQAVAPEPPGFSFHAALFVTGRRVAVIALEAPVRTERDHPLRFLPLMAAQNFLARLGNLWVDSGSGEGSVEEAAEFAAGGLEGSLLLF